MSELIHALSGLTISSTPLTASQRRNARRRRAKAAAYHSQQSFESLSDDSYSDSDDTISYARSCTASLLSDSTQSFESRSFNEKLQFYHHLLTIFG